jgi:membrane protein
MPRRATSTSSALVSYSKLVARIAVAGITAQIARLTKSTNPQPTSRSTHAPGRRSARPRLGARAWWSILRDTVFEWLAHKASTLGAAIAYYSLFSIGPLILIVITVAGLLFGEEAVRGQVFLGLSSLLGEQGAKAVENMLAVAGRPAEGVFSAMISAGALIFAAIGVVVQLKVALNTVWEVESPAGSGIWSFIRTYAVSLAGVLSLGFLLLISLLLTTALAAIGDIFAGAVPELLLQVTSFVVTFAMTALLFAMMFKWLPDIAIGWREVVPGSILTAALFEIGKYLIGFYIGKQGLESTFGAAASLVVLLIWVYYSAQLVLFGAEFTRVYAQAGGFRPDRRQPAYKPKKSVESARKAVE